MLLLNNQDSLCAELVTFLGQDSKDVLHVCYDLFTKS